MLISFIEIHESLEEQNQLVNGELYAMFLRQEITR